MSMKTVRQLDEEAKGLLSAAKTIYELGDDATPEQIDEAKSSEAKAVEIVGKLESLKANQLESLKSINRIENTMAGFRQADRPGFGGGEDPGFRPDGGGSPRSGHDRAVKSIGEMFAEDPAIKAWREEWTPQGRIPEEVRGMSPALAMKSLKALVTSTDDSTAGRPLLGQADRREEIVRLGWPELVLRQMVTNLTTNTDLVEVVREVSRTNNAAGVAEATADTGTSGEKPQSALTWTVDSVPVETVAHWIPATTRVLADSNRLRGEIDTFLYSGLDDTMEDTILNGNGTSPQFPGVNNTSGILTQPYDTGLLVTTRKAKTKIRVDGKARPTGYLFHPNDDEALDLLIDAEERYYFGGPVQAGIPMLWGLPRMSSEHQTAGVGLLANWKDAVIYDREQASIRMGTIDRFFVRNLIAILAELRAAFHLRRPRSFVSIDLTAA